MFTGLIEATGALLRIRPQDQGIRIAIQTDRNLVSELTLGESVAVDGACLTVVEFGGDQFEVEATAETLSCTTLGSKTIGQIVHLERALPLGGRLGGHLVTGHIDGIGQIRSKQPSGQAIIITIDVPKPMLKALVPKGSIAIDGISLTVNDVDDSGFNVALIPHTQSVVHLADKAVGDAVNLESDIISKYVERLLHFRHTDEGGTVDMELLQRTGFVQ